MVYIGEKKMDFFKCKHCDEVFEKIFEGAVCEQEGCACEDMARLEPKHADWKNEKHVPVIEKAADGTVAVKVGSTLHPMVDDHWITMIELWDGELMLRQFLRPGMEPIAKFPIKFKEGLKAKEYCNIHGLWETN